MAPDGAINIEGTLLVWQLSQAALVGTWAGVRLSMVLGVTPKKLPLPTPLPWQLVQPLPMPLWLKAPLANLSPSTTCAPVMLEPGAMWQVSQPRLPMAMWLDGGATIGFSAVADAYCAALALLWHWAQLLLLDWIQLWMLPTVGIVPNGLWQLLQLAALLYGM